VRSHNRVEKSFQSTYLDKSVEEVISHLVKLRGELHHHTSRRSGIWHPTDHVRFGADALFLQQLCFAVAFAIAGDAWFEERTIREYQAQASASTSQNELQIYRK
jgi:hypothetical protein